MATAHSVIATHGSTSTAQLYQHRQRSTMELQRHGQPSSSSTSSAPNVPAIPDSKEVLPSPSQSQEPAATMRIASDAGYTSQEHVPSETIPDAGRERVASSSHTPQRRVARRHSPRPSGSTPPQTSADATPLVRALPFPSAWMPPLPYNLDDILYFQEVLTSEELQDLGAGGIDWKDHSKLPEGEDVTKPVCMHQSVIGISLTQKAFMTVPKLCRTVTIQWPKFPSPILQYGGRHVHDTLYSFVRAQRYGNGQIAQAPVAPEYMRMPQSAYPPGFQTTPFRAAPVAEGADDPFPAATWRLAKPKIEMYMPNGATDEAVGRPSKRSRHNATEPGPPLAVYTPGASPLLGLEHHLSIPANDFDISKIDPILLAESPLGTNGGSMSSRAHNSIASSSSQQVHAFVAPPSVPVAGPSRSYDTWSYPPFENTPAASQSPAPAVLPPVASSFSAGPYTAALAYPSHPLHTPADLEISPHGGYPHSGSVPPPQQSHKGILDDLQDVTGLSEFQTLAGLLGLEREDASELASEARAFTGPPESEVSEGRDGPSQSRATSEGSSATHETHEAPPSSEGV
ncbi:uncharacterized protein LAESUDRAFT_812611 [Laetiporus sulphureus 93-53]|uniref:Uncharacterized protein n=1 Tax=Laetiporus sulphureus 93-53 TaxID=1314785 RepID=A0A165EB25_9APHY|nr:uncharacterized protein LAESUDRAFT_812611 [Laetiporus sulphureus 93-53]KZT06634.1 hypothetical protein LAESUDRAFT_812611 [Laetiporus sulphureus 93-53]